MRMLQRLALALAWLPLALAPSAARAAFSLQPGIGFVAVQDAAVGAEFALEDAEGRRSAAATRTSSAAWSSATSSRARGTRCARPPPGAPVTPVEALRFSPHPKAAFYASRCSRRASSTSRCATGRCSPRWSGRRSGRPSRTGPFPTVVEYSGYAAADPDNPQPSTLIASALGFATVGVNMRGSGCSGGAFDLFDLPTTADGYDVIETVAAQPWVQHGKVGMVGISFPGISQVFVGGARPPHLAAVAPLSVIADIYRAPGFPGGIFNDGFAQSWLEDRKNDSEPAPDGGQGYAEAPHRGRRHHVPREPAAARARRRTRFAIVDREPVLPARAHGRALAERVGRKIKVPAFFARRLAGRADRSGRRRPCSRARRAQEREGHAAERGAQRARSSRTILWRWLEFLQIYVGAGDARPSKLPLLAPLVVPRDPRRGGAEPALPRRPLRGRHARTRRRASSSRRPARARAVRERRRHAPSPGSRRRRSSSASRSWPPKEAKPTAWYFGAGGALLPAPPSGADEGVDELRADPEARPMQTLPGHGGDSWACCRRTTGSRSSTGPRRPGRRRPLDGDVTIVGPGASTSGCARARRTPTSR